MNRILAYLTTMLLYTLLSLPCILLIRYYIGKKRKKYNILREAVMIAFFAFLIALASVTIIPEFTLDANGLHIIRTGKNGLNLNLFGVLTDTYIEVFYNNNIQYFLINFLGNILLFMPIGFLLPLLWQKMRLFKVLLIGFLISLTIEICQISLPRGTDVDDLWLNTLGALLGYLLFILIQKLFPTTKEKLKKPY